MGGQEARLAPISVGCKTQGLVCSLAGAAAQLPCDIICLWSPQEKQDKAVLQAEVQHLRQDNMRLQEESQTATAQLRKFTEWFFSTIDKKA